MSGIFINYRSTDQPLGAAAIHDQLSRRFGADQVFRDCVSMKPGEHYPTELRKALEEADILVVVVGPGWLTCADDNGRRRIDDPRDWVRYEIAQGFRRDIEILPVLLQNTPADTRPLKQEELPADIARLANIQQFSFSQLRFGTDLDRLSDRLIELVPTLIIPRLFEALPAAFQPANAPSTLLRAEHEIVPFTGRSRELADLLSWAAGTATASARLVVGPAGCGKTRLAIALANKLRAQNWLAGIVSGEAPAVQIRHALSINRPLLAIVDDAELRVDQLTALAAALSERSAGIDAPARLLLLSRSDGDWLAQLRRSGDDDPAKLLRGMTKATTIRLEPAAEDAQAHYHAARTAFAAELGVDPRNAPPLEFGPAVSVLRIHAAALVDALAGSPGTDELAAVVERDRRRCEELLRDRGHNGLDRSLVEMISTFGTLCSPASEAQAQSVRARMTGSLGLDAALVDECGKVLGLLFPGHYPFEAVRPELIGEILVAQTLSANPAIVIALATTCTDDQIMTAFTVLGRALVRHPSLSDAVVRLVRVRSEHLLPIAVAAANRLEEPEPFVRALAAAIQDDSLSADGAMALLHQLSTTGPALNPLKAAANKVFANVFAMPLRTQAMSDVEVPAELAPLTTMIDRLTGMFVDGVSAIIDPKSGSLPTNPDGSPLFSDDLLGLIRRIWVNKDLFPDDDDK